MSKRTFQPNNRRRHKTHGFRLRKGAHRVDLQYVAHRINAAAAAPRSAAVVGRFESRNQIIHRVRNGKNRRHGETMLSNLPSQALLLTYIGIRYTFCCEVVGHGR